MQPGAFRPDACLPSVGRNDIHSRHCNLGGGGVAQNGVARVEIGWGTNRTTETVNVRGCAI